MKDNVHDTPYSRTVELMRQDPVFYQNQSMQEIGLKKVDPTILEKNNASGALAMVFETMSNFAHAGKPVENHYYTYGWTGLLSKKQRFLDAQTLYNLLGEEVAKFKAQGINPKIRVVGYSHGGNVCLNLALARQEDEKESNTPPRLTVNDGKESKTPSQFTVNELVLLGMPVQHETDFLVCDPMFEKVYHIYSRGDRVQKLDFFSLNRFFSRRVFQSRKGFKLPDKLIQIQIKCTRIVPSNAKRTQQRRQDPTYAYNFKNPAVIGGKAHYMRDASPGHTELWFFGWTPIHYRDHFPLNPFPIVAVLPIILHVTNDFQEKNLFSKPTLIDIRPEHEIMVIKNQKSKRVLTFARFLSKSEQEKLTNIVLRYAPDNYTQEMYNGRIKIAYDTAHSEHRAKATYKHHKKRRLSEKKRRKLAEQEAIECLQEHEAALEKLLATTTPSSLSCPSVEPASSAPRQK